jgi:hypothetical protein
MREVYDVRTTTMYHKCRICRKVLAPQMLVAVFIKRKTPLPKGPFGSGKYELTAWECLHHKKRPGLHRG